MARNCFLLFFAIAWSLLDRSLACAQAVPEILVEDTPLEAPSTVEDSRYVMLAPESGSFLEAGSQAFFQQRLQGEWSQEGLKGGQLQYTFDGVPLNDSWTPHREVQPFQGSGFAFRPENSESLAFGPRVAFSALEFQNSDRTRYFALVGTGSYLAAGMSYQGPTQSFEIAASDDSRLSQADRALDGNSEADETLSLNLQYRKNLPSLGAQFSALYIEEQNDLDYGGGAAGDDSNYKSRSHAVVISLRGRRSQLAYRLSLRGSRNLPDARHTQDLDTRYSSHSLPLLLNLANWEFSNASIEARLRSGVEWGAATEDIDGVARAFRGKRLFTLDPEMRAQALWGDTRFEAAVSWLWFFRNLDSVAATKGARPQAVTSLLHTWNERDSSQIILEQSLRVPSLYELYSNYGNTSLRGEESRAIKFFQSLKSSAVTFQLGTFYRELDEMIDFDFASEKYFNQSHASVAGLTFKLEFPLAEQQGFSASLNLLRTRDASGKAWLRRATWNADLAWLSTIPYLGGEMEIQERLVGPRDDLDPIDYVTPRRLKSFATTSLTYLRPWNKFAKPSALRVLIRFENLFNLKYQEVAGYESLSFNALVGLQGDLDD